MTLEATPPSVGTEENLLIVFMPACADINAPTVTEWDAGTPITYSLTPDGWKPTASQATVVDDRLTLAQAMERPGKKTKSLSVQYVYGTEDDVAAPALEEGTAGFIGVRAGVPNETAGTAAQKVTIWPVLCGEQMEDPAVANGVFTMTQTLFVTGQVAIRVGLVAGS